PDVRDGLKPSQRRILVAMNDLNLGPNSSRIKCAKIAGDTSGNYHPHGEGSVYPTLVRMAQNWVMREILIDKQGNFGSLAGLPPAAMRYTEARLSAVASELLDDINRDTVDYVPTYDQRLMEPVVLPSRLPNLLINGSTGIAVGMATSVPPHNLAEVCNATVVLIDNPDAGLDDLLEVLEGPDFPTGGIICGRMGLRQGYLTGRSTVTMRARTHFEEDKNHDVIVVTEIPYLETRDRLREKLEELVRDERIKGISRIIDLTDRTLPAWQVRLHIVIKRDADKEVVLNQLFQFSPLQGTFSFIMLALVGSRPQLLTLKETLQEFLRHRIDVIRRRTEFMLAEARKRKHTVEGLLIAQLNIDEVIATIRRSSSRAVAREELQKITVPSEMIARALGEKGFTAFQGERGVATEYSLSQTQAEAIVAMQLGSLAGLERDKLGEEFSKLLDEIAEYVRILSDEANILAIIRDEMVMLAAKYNDKRRTTITDEELSYVDRGDLITEEPMVVTLSHRGYIKRMALDTYQAQHRGGRGITGAKVEDDDPIEHLFVASTHDFLLFFTDRGKVFWQKVYDLPLLSRTSKGRALVNLLQLQEGEKIFSCLAVRHFDAVRQLLMATRKGIVKKSPLAAYSRPKKGGIIAIKLEEGDELIDVVIVGPANDVLLATANGHSIRFAQSDARSMGRNSRGVKGIKLSKGDHVVGMVVADPEMDLLSICENGYGKRTPFGYEEPIVVVETPVVSEDGAEEDVPVEEPAPVEEPDEVEGEGEEAQKSSMRYRRQKRGGKGLVNIKTTARNGKVVDIIGVSEQDEVLMVTSQGKIQRIRVRDINQIGRGTQGVTIIRMEEGDTVASIARVPSEDITVVTPAEVLTAPSTPVADAGQPEIETPDVETPEEETDDN
ncbi:MAG: gyrase, subunit, partial [Planctomycetaceae bacterium]|nr:gyrase, subunit [Planctomycetaceae bacterium]